jgi:hypothetical protein
MNELKKFKDIYIVLFGASAHWKATRGHILYDPNGIMLKLNLNKFLQKMSKSDIFDHSKTSFSPQIIIFLLDRH